MNTPINTRNMRRRQLLGGGAAALSVAGVAALAGAATPAAARTLRRGLAAQDATLLNTAVALEHEGIAAYQIALDSGLLAAEVAALARVFQGHHKQHRDHLSAAIARLGAHAVDAKPLKDYAVALNASAIKTQTDILKLALRLERGAANAYLGLIKPLQNSDLDLLVARLAADEVMHTTVFMSALKQQIPETAPVFG